MSARYIQSAEQSAGLVRLILPRIAQHGGTFYPTTYAVWYEYLAGINAPLAEAIDRLLIGPNGVSPADVERLFAQYVNGYGLQSHEHAQRDLSSLLVQLKSITTEAKAGAVSCGASFRECQERLHHVVDKNSLTLIVADLIRHSTAAVQMVQSLDQRVEERYRELADLEKQLADAQSEAVKDPLTKLLNRRGLERSSNDLTSGRVRGLSGCALLMVDIDHFKRINDTYGHLFGDRVLCSIARVLQDGVKGRDIIARFGGDEFVILAPDTKVNGAVALAQQLRGAVARGRLRRGKPGEFAEQTSVSIGVVGGNSEDSLEQLLARADEALYRAKKSGRDCVCAAADRRSPAQA